VAITAQRIIYNRYEIGTRIDRPHTRLFVYVSGLAFMMSGLAFGQLGWAMIALLVILAVEVVLGFFGVVNELFKGYSEGRE